MFCSIVTVAAAAVSIPLASVLAHLRRAEVSSTWLVSISRAVPTFAIAALLVPWSLERGWGFEPWPIFISLLLLALVPIYLITYTAIRQLPDGPVDAARALGLQRTFDPDQGRVGLGLVADLQWHPGGRHPGGRNRANPSIPRRRRFGTLCSRWIRTEQQHPGPRWDRSHRWPGRSDRSGFRGAGTTRAAERHPPTHSTTRRNITMTTLEHSTPRRAPPGPARGTRSRRRRVR